MSLPDISVIIPVYNGEKYLEKAILSVIKQPNKSLELIIINDGSIDNSSEICDYFKSKDKRIKVIHKKNEGVEVSRNLGIKLSKGKYITFLDQDDEWVKDVYNEDIKYILNDNHDVICFGYYLANQNIDRIKERKVISKTIDCKSGYENIKSLSWYHHSSYFFKRDLIVKNNILITKGRHEDEIFRDKCLYKAKKIQLVDKNLFYYRNNYQSVTHQNIDVEKLYYSLLENWLSAKEWYRLQNKYDEDILNFCDHMIGIYALEMIKQKCKSKLCNKNDINKLLKTNCYDLYLEKLKYEEAGKSVKLDYKLYTENEKVFIIKYFIIGKLDNIARFIISNIPLLKNVRDYVKYDKKVY